MEQPAVATKHPLEINRIMVRGRWRCVVVDNDRALHGDGEIFITGEEGSNVGRAYVESRKASCGHHTESLLQARTGLILRGLQLLA